MIITRGEIKDLLGIADTSRDTFIDANLPVAVSFLFSEFNNYFEVATEKIFIEAETISFESGNQSKIKDSDNGFVDAGFVKGLNLRIKGSSLNDKVVSIKDVSAGEIIIGDGETLIDEDAGEEVKLTVVVLPDEAKLFVAKLIEWNFPNKANSQGVESERFDDYAVKYIIKSEIPQSIMQIMEPYRKLRW